MKRRALQILWPAFVAAGVLEMLVFAVIDPTSLRWFGGPPILWSAQAVYSVTFLMFWALIAMAGAITALLAIEPDDVDGPVRSDGEAPRRGAALPAGRQR